MLYGLPLEARYLLNNFFLGRWPEFIFGMMVAQRFARGEQVEHRPSFSPSLIVSSLILLMTGCVLSLSQSPVATLFVDISVGGGFSLLLMAALESSRTNGRLACMFSTGPLVKLGIISYSLYLTHSICLAWVDRPYFRLTHGISKFHHDFLILIINAFLIGLLAVTFYRVVEKRFVRSVDLAQPDRGRKDRTSSVPHRIHGGAVAG